MKRLTVFVLATLIIISTGMTGILLANDKCPLDLWWNMDLPGADFRNFAIGRSSNAPTKEIYAKEARECKQACARDQRCAAWSYAIQELRCYLKEAVTKPVVKGHFVSGIRANPPVRNAPVTAGQIGVDRPGGDYRSFNLQRADARLCQQACNNEQRCRAWAMTKPSKNNRQAHCYLKDQTPQQQPNANVISGLKQQ